MKKVTRKKSVLERFDFTDARQELARDMKVAAKVFALLWLMSIAGGLPFVHVLLRIGGIEAADLAVSPWMSWMFFALAHILYFAQLALRIKAKDSPVPQEHACKPGKPQPRKNERTGKNIAHSICACAFVARSQNTESSKKQTA